MQPSSIIVQILESTRLQLCTCLVLLPQRQVLESTTCRLGFQLVRCLFEFRTVHMRNAIVALIVSSSALLVFLSNLTHCGCHPKFICVYV
jgi:hypothetical protein